ncbi:MAG: hypothetical protein GY815_15165 [Gammaproteobacteria bacterium]|nr:hypothetical protein [Gammaproteobacteria bacterium]
MTFTTIEFVIENGLAGLTFSRPERLNSFNAQMQQGVREAMETVRRDPGR